MNLIKLLVPLLVGSFLIMSSYATDIQIPSSWVENDNGNASVAYSSDYNDETKIFEAKISHSKSGIQRLYFSDYFYESSNSCKYESIVPDSTTVIFSGQAVRMSSWCTKFTDTGDYYYSLTPSTERGHNYVINLFKIATSPIEIQYNNETLYFPVMGFTKAWNSAGGNAI